MAAVLASGPGAVLSHGSAAALWGIRPTAAVRVEVTVPRTSGYRSNRRVIVHHPRRAWVATVRDCIPVTTPTQTLIDLSSVLPRPALERALEAAESLRLLDAKSLPPKLAKLAGMIEPRLRSPLAFERDRERDAALTAIGWRVVRITHRRLAAHADEVGDLLERLLSARSPWPATPG